MNYTIYIESLNNFPIADWGVSALQGFRDKQANIVFFEEIDEVPTSKYNIVVACIETTNKYLERFGMGPKMALNIPEELNSSVWLQRKLFTNTLEHLNRSLLPLFIKPAGKAKEFVAGVVRNAKDMDLFFHHLPSETAILCSEVVEFVSEYRCYIINGEIKGVKHYIGDMFTFPDGDFMKRCVAAYKSAPSGYSMDFGVLKNGQTVLVECNDGWSLGNYGLDHSIYARLLSTRWLEIMKSF